MKRGNPTRADSPGNKKCIGKDITRISDHAEYICRDIFNKEWKYMFPGS